jgi:hypothetical protein
MRPCRLCHFPVELDDAALVLPSGACVCLPCFGRETGSARPMPAALRRQLVVALATVDTPSATTDRDGW